MPRTNCSDIGCESCERVFPGFDLRATCPTCGHALCPRILPARLGGLRA